MQTKNLKKQRFFSVIMLKVQLYMYDTKLHLAQRVKATPSTQMTTWVTVKNGVALKRLKCETFSMIFFGTWSMIDIDRTSSRQALLLHPTQVLIKPGIRWWFIKKKSIFDETKKPTGDLLCSTLSACRSSNRGLTLLNIFCDQIKLTPKQMIMKPMFSLFVSFVICQSSLQFMTFDMPCELPESDRLDIHYYFWGNHQ